MFPKLHNLKKGFMLFRYLHILIIGLVSLTFGCASKIPQELNLLNVTEPCCSSFKDIPYQEISAGFNEEYSMSKQQTFEFDTGKSFFKGFAIKNGSIIEVKTHLDGDYIPTAQVYWPSFITLDDQKEVVRKFDNPSLQRVHTLMGYHYWLGNIELLGNEKYIIIYTQDNCLGKQVFVKNINAVSGYYTSSGLVYVPDYNQDSIYSTLSPGGLIEVSVLVAKKE